jgi:hypothetical protein
MGSGNPDHPPRDDEGLHREVSIDLGVDRCAPAIDRDCKKESSQNEKRKPLRVCVFHTHLN